MSYTRAEFSVAVFHAIGNTNPHPWMQKWFEAWTCRETGPYSEKTPGALNNLLNTTEPGYGDNLLPHWNSIGVRQYPTFEDGVAATAHSLIGGTVHYYPTILDALRTNNGAPLQHPTQEVINELNTWSGNANYAQEILDLANSGNTRGDEVFPGRHVGHPS